MRLALVPVAALSLVAVAAGPALAATGTGSAVTVVTGTTIAGTLSIAGVGAAASLSGAPGSFTSAAGVTALTVSDLTGSTNGWAVTATYSPVSGTTDVGGANVHVSTGGVVPNALGGVLASAVATVTDSALDTPVTVATTGTAGGSGITAMTASYKVRLPVTAQVGNVFGGQVTYTVASVR
ncbi:MAG: hypothetical protein JWM64_2656 [Frankiales bacterium]|nr:hypothetical protein [Frankiales bacterium]